MRIIFYSFSIIDLIGGFIILATSDIFLGNIGKLIGILLLLKGLYSIFSALFLS